VAENCSGSGASCPSDGFVANGTTCNDGNSSTCGEVCTTGACGGGGSCSNAAPTTSITSPAGGTFFTAPASITINANASDSDGTINRVEFYNGANLLNAGGDTTSPYSYGWTGVGVGSYSLTSKAFDNLSATGTSSAVSVTVCAALAAPTGVTTSNVTSSSAQVSWTAPAGADANTRYKLLRSTTSGSGYASIGADSLTSTSYVNNTLNASTTYYYVVQAINCAGAASANSAQASATTLAAVPAAPANPLATPGNAQVALSWSASTGATSYTVRRSTTSGGPYNDIATGVAGTSHTDTTAVNGTLYYYVIAAVNGSGTSPNSSQVSATPSAGGGGSQVFFDDFQDGNSTGWSQAWTVVTDGSTMVYQSAPAALSFAGSAWGAQTVEAKVNVGQWGGTSSSYRVGIIGRYVDSSNYYVLAVDNQATRKLKLLKSSSSISGTGCADVDAGVGAIGTIFTLKLEVTATQLKSYVNGTLKQTCTPSTMLGNGKIGVMTYGSNTWAKFDDVKVTTP
jgi:cellulose 1,4-beta-cellobiosidase